MSSRTDWMPASRIGQLGMAKKWVAYISTALATQWGIPPAVLSDLSDYTNSANDALETAMTVNRTEAINANVRVTFGALVSHMRDIKRRYLFSLSNYIIESEELIEDGDDLYKEFSVKFNLTKTNPNPSAPADGSSMGVARASSARHHADPYRHR